MTEAQIRAALDEWPPVENAATRDLALRLGLDITQQRRWSRIETVVVATLAAAHSTGAILDAPRIGILLKNAVAVIDALDVLRAVEESR